MLARSYQSAYHYSTIEVTNGFHFSCYYLRLLIHHGKDVNAAEPPVCLEHIYSLNRCEGVQGHSNALQHLNCWKKRVPIQIIVCFYIIAMETSGA